ncbi:MAG: DUF2182 domain-containing protein [Deltaproteobacteria bacterium]
MQSAPDTSTEMPMPGGWTMSMAWMRIPGQTWLGAAASFLGMWIVMMIAMMLPPLLPMLWRYRQAVTRTAETRLGMLTALVGAGYFCVWTALGMLAFPLGVGLAALEMQQPALASIVPIAVGGIVLIAGAHQFSAWKAHHLGCCRQGLVGGCTLPADAGTAWRHGLRLGLHCSRCCAGLTAILLAPHRASRRARMSCLVAFRPAPPYLRGSRRSKLAVPEHREQETPLVDAHEYWPAAAGRCLQPRGHLARHPRRNTGVVQADAEEQRWIGEPRYHMQVRIHLDQPVQALGRVGRAQLSELVRSVLGMHDAQRVQNTDSDLRRGEQVGPLGDGPPDEHTAHAPALGSQTLP